MIAPKAKTCNTDGKSNGVRSGVAKKTSSASTQCEYESTKFTDTCTYLVKAFHRSFSQGTAHLFLFYLMLRLAIDHSDDVISGCS